MACFHRRLLYHLLGIFVYAEWCHGLLVVSIFSGIGLQDYQHGGGLGMWSGDTSWGVNVYTRTIESNLVNTSRSNLKVFTFYRWTTSQKMYLIPLRGCSSTMFSALVLFTHLNFTAFPSRTARRVCYPTCERNCPLSIEALRRKSAGEKNGGVKHLRVDLLGF